MGFILCMNCGEMYVENEQNETECICCHSSNVAKIPEEYNLRGKDYLDIIRIKEEPNFILSMIELKHDDPIEYELKMRQFKVIEEEKNKIRCPKCDSTQITTGARGVSHFWGFIGASKTVNRCAKCGYTWKP